MNVSKNVDTLELVLCCSTVAYIYDKGALEFGQVF